MSEVTALDTLLQDLVYARAKLATLTETLTAKREAFEESLADLKHRRSLEQETVKAIEATIRTTALQLYTADPEHKKAIHPKVHERDIRIITYDDEQAYTWCVRHALFLTIDRKELEAYCRTAKSVPEFVSIKAEPQITIAKEL